MERNILIIVLVVVLVLFYINKIHESYTSGSYDITPSITTNMDWKNATLSKYPYFTNNLVTPPTNVLNKIEELQKYQPKSDGYTDTNYVSTGMNVHKNLDNPATREGFKNLENFEDFQIVNPYIQN